MQKIMPVIGTRPEAIKLAPVIKELERYPKELLRNGIQTQPFFLDMHEQPAFRKMGLFINEHYPVAERIAKQGLYLPSGLTLKEEEIKKITKVIEKILENQRNE